GAEVGVVVLEDDQLTVAPQPAAGIDHGARARRLHGGAGAGVDIDALEDLVGVVLPGHGAVHRPLPAAGGRGHGGRRFGRWCGGHRTWSRGGGNGGRVGGRRRRGGPGGGGGFDTDGFDLEGFGGDFPCRDRHG